MTNRLQLLKREEEVQLKRIDDTKKRTCDIMQRKMNNQETQEHVQTISKGVLEKEYQEVRRRVVEIIPDEELLHEVAATTGTRNDARGDDQLQEAGVGAYEVTSTYRIILGNRVPPTKKPSTCTSNP